MKVHIAQHCENAPKKKLVLKLTILWASGNVPEMGAYLADELEWDNVGQTHCKGKTNFLKEVEALTKSKVAELRITSIITHGKSAAVYGEMKMMDGTALAFSDLYEFTSASASILKSVTSFRIHL
ncbi:nuclear transport factor 2 family protein [Dyadobacter tibetensis]|uniref:nuclear transport factor 2 family protein n=1 Tax=Dyadobacter tibetensis TaxID=1211851 RepID=UPI00047172C1|nr:nuclear transport factor 2 family protein [Dyadobacter tibetensis]